MRERCLLYPEADIVCDKVRIMKPVTIALVRTHGVRQLLGYCNGKRESDWPCHGELPIEQFSAEEALPDIQRRCRYTKIRMAAC